jgi:iron complex outermembrane receptor protein
MRASSGMSAEFNTLTRDRLSVTGALRIQRDAGGSAGTGHITALPMFGAAYLLNVGGAEIKMRGSFGKGERWPSMTALRDHMQLSRISLEPEEQTGLEAGVDLRVRRMFTMQLTRFDQTATGLAQQVTLPYRLQAYKNAPPRFGVELQNVGAISNKGWEMQAALHRGALSLSSAATFLNSRVVRVAGGYTGDLKPGDHPLAIPARTLSFTAAVTRTLWSASLTAYRAADWINYDRIAMDGDSAAAGATNLRQYWKNYDGFTHLGLSATRSLRSGLALSFGASNLLNNQIGEPDNITIVPGRTYSLGVRAIF